MMGLRYPLVLHRGSVFATATTSCRRLRDGDKIMGLHGVSINNSGGSVENEDDY